MGTFLSLANELILVFTAMDFYNLTPAEMDALPSYIFEKKNAPMLPGRSYVHLYVERLVFRKLATLAGRHRDGITERELLRQGSMLFDEK